MKTKDLLKIYLKILLAGSFTSQLVFLFYKLFFDHFDAIDLVNFIPMVFADMLFSILFLFIAFFVSMLFLLDSESKESIFNFKRHYSVQIITLIFFGGFPIIKEMYESNALNFFYIYAIAHTIISYAMGYLIIENYRLRI